MSTSLNANRPPVAAPSLVVCCSIVATLLVASACITRQAPTDLSNSVTGPTAIVSTTSRPTTTTPVTTTPPSTVAPPPTTTPPATITAAYTPDLQPVFQADCVRCHSGSRPYANYSMTTYAQVMRAVAPGNARSSLVVTTQRSGSMYRYWSGNAAAKAELVRSWVVVNAAAEKR